MIAWRHVAGIVATLALPAQASAQAIDAAGRPAGLERRISAGLTIPLGPRHAAGKPQLELRAVGERGESDLRWLRRTGGGWLPPAREETRIGVTLEPRPQLTVDGRELAADPARHGISTVAWIAIGVGVALVVGGVIFVDALNDASD